MIEGVMPGRRKQTKKAKKPTRSPAKSPKKKELAPGQWFEKLVAVQACLRAPNGCPWDREQTHQSLRTYLLEEAYEVLEALESGTTPSLRKRWATCFCRLSFIRRSRGKRGASRCRT